MSQSAPDRYATARELGEDLRRFLGDEPIRAKRPTVGKIATRWCRRHIEALAPVVAALLAAFATGMIVASLAWQREREHRWFAVQAQERAERSEAETQQLLYASNIKLANQAWQEGDLPRFLELLDRCVPDDAEQPDLRGFEWHYLKQRLHRNRVSLANQLQAVYQVRYSPDGRRLAAVGEDDLIRVFDLRTFRQEVVLATGQGEVNGISFAPGGTICASAGDDGTIRVWNLATGMEIRSIQAHSGEAYNVLFALGGNRLVSCGEDLTIRIWDVRTGKAAGSLTGHQRAVEAIALSPDDRTLASASSDKTARLWDLATLAELHTLVGHDDRLTSIAFSTNGRMVGTGSIDKTVGFWDVQTGQLVGRGQQLDPIQSVAFAHNSRLLAAGDRAGTIRIWNVPTDGDALATPSTGHLIGTAAADLLQGHTGRVYSIVFSRASNQLISAGADGQMIIWSLRGVSPEVDLAPVGVTDELVFARNGKLVLASQSGVHVQDTMTSEVVRTLADGSQRWQSLAVSPTGLVAAGSKSGRLIVWELATAEVIRSWELGESVDRGQLAFSPDGKYLAVASWQHADGAVRLFEVQSGDSTHSFAATLANAVAFSPDGLQLVADSQNDLLMWNVASGQLLRCFAGHTSTIKALGYTPDSRFLFSSGKDRTVKLWDVSTGSLFASLPGHRDEVWAVACSPDGRSLVTADQSGVIIFHQTATGQELLKLEPRSLPVDKLAFSPDGNELAYLLEDGLTRVIRLTGQGGATD
jgi:WD40 repeat protein